MPEGEPQFPVGGPFFGGNGLLPHLQGGGQFRQPLHLLRVLQGHRAGALALHQQDLPFSGLPVGKPLLAGKGHPLFPLGVGKQAEGQDKAQNRRPRQHPKGGLFVAQDVLDAALHIVLPKGQGAHQAALPLGNGQQRGRIALADVRPQDLHHRLVAGHLHVPAEEEVGGPQHRVEPVDAEEQKGQGLDEVVLPADVDLLVAEDIPPLLLGEAQGQVDPGPEKAQDKGGGDPVAFPDVPLPQHRPPEPLPEAQVGEDAVGQQKDKARLPDQVPDLQPKLHRVGGSRRGGRGQALVHRLVEEPEAALDLRLWGVDDLLGDGLGPGHQAEGAGEGHRTDQPEQHHRPQGVGKDLRGPAEEQSPRHHQEGRPGRPDAHI